MKKRTKKSWIGVALFAVLAVAAVMPQQVRAASGDFTIKDGVLTKYHGRGGDVTIPDGVTSIGDDVFRDCSGLAGMRVADGNQTYDSRGNCDAIIETASNTLIAGCKNTAIPEGVTSISSRAFNGCSGLTSVTIPDSVTSIYSDAFYGCSGLESMRVADGNRTYDSRGNCDAIIETTSNTLIVGCKNTAIPEGVTSIGSYAFRGCSGLTSVTIPASVMSIGGSAFNGCSGLESMRVADGNRTYDSRGNCDAIIETTSNTLIAGCKNTVIPDGVTSIDYGAFYGHSGLTNVAIPGSVTSIDNLAFEGCSGLTNVTISEGVTSIGDSAFSGCSGLTSVTIPGSVARIGGWAFYGCESLTDITILNREAELKFSEYGDGEFSCIFGGFEKDGSLSIRNGIKVHGYLNSTAEKIVHKVNEHAGKALLTFVTLDGTGGSTTTENSDKTQNSNGLKTPGKWGKTDKPKTVTLKKVSSPKKGALKLTWKKDKKATGYQAMVATDKKFKKNKKTATIKKNKTVSKTFTKLKRGKTYFAKVRAYKKVGKKNIYGAYSKVKKARVK